MDRDHALVLKRQCHAAPVARRQVACDEDLERGNVGEQFGKNAGLLFEISVKSNLLILLYEPGDDQGIGSVIQARCNEIGLPNNLWLDVAWAIMQHGMQ